MKKRMLAIILASVLFLTAVPGALALGEKTGTVRGGWLILRGSPSFNGAILASYPTGTVVTITGQTGSWYAVKTPDGLTGYMLGDYLTISSGSSVAPGTVSDYAYVTSANGLNVRLRTGPGTGYSILASYAPGTQCAVLNWGANWSRITIGTLTGYMMTKFLTTTDPGQPTPPAPTPAGEYDVWVTSKNGRGVNLRSGAGKEYPSIGFYSVGTSARMISAGPVWSYIRVGSRYGYMMSEFLTTTPVTPVVPPHGEAYVISANGKNVNLRSGPGTNYPAITSYKVGTPLTIISRGAVWYYIRIGNTYGYMMRQFIVEGNFTTSYATSTDLH